MIRETGADYKKAIVAVAIAGGVGATVAGAGLLAYRLWRRRTCCGREKKADKQPDPVHTVTVSEPGASVEKPIDQPSSIVQPVANISPQPATQISATDFLSTSGTFEKVPSPAPESFEQISMSQMQESRVTPPAASVAAAESQLPASASTEPDVQTAASEPLSSSLSSSSAAAADDSSAQPSRVHMKEKNDIVMVETNSSSSEDADAGGKQSSADGAGASSASGPAPDTSDTAESPSDSGSAPQSS